MTVYYHRCIFLFKLAR